tara:strand:+ start:2729 stop:2839 length:111 start_codon:yes stop_codon:yes gene_type:complete
MFCGNIFLGLPMIWHCMAFLTHNVIGTLAVFIDDFA